MARVVNYKSSEEAFIAGFRHDIGQPVMCMIFAGDVPRIGRLINRTDDPVRHEREKLGIDHQEVGEWLGKKWNLPSILLKPIRLHHQVGRSIRDRSPELLVDVIFGSDLIVNKLTDPTVVYDEVVDLVADDIALLLGINRDDLAQIIDQTAGQVREIARELNIEIADLAPLPRDAAGLESAITAPPQFQETLKNCPRLSRNWRFSAK
jgi:HD-like signal output (HDOD) protein